MTIDVRGKTVVLTGSFSRLKRADAEAQLVKLGAKIGSGVSKATHVLFAGEKAGSKINAAGKLGVTVLGEDDLMAVLRGPGAGAAAPVAVSAFVGLDPALKGDVLARAIAALPWDAIDVDRDLPPLREALYAHEAAHGITAAHHEATGHVRPLAVLAHAHGHDVEVEWTGLSPDGRFLATGSWTGDDYDLGGVLQIWDVRAGRCVNKLRIHGGVGWPGYGPCIQWRPDSRRVGLTFDTNGVGSFDPFARTGEPESVAYITDGWDSPPAWAWSANSRDVYIACWGPDLALGAIVPLVGRSPEPRWCASIATSPGDSEPRLQPMKEVSWNHPDRIVGATSWSQVFALDAKTGALLWEGKAHPPVSFSPDGEAFAMHPAGLVYYDASTGLPNGKLPMHVGAESFVWSKGGKRMVALVQPGNQWSADPGVFVYDAGVYRYSPDAAKPRTHGKYAASWSPDGRKLAVTAGGRLQIWALGEQPVKQIDVAAPASSVEYGDGVLIAWSSSGLMFVRELDGAEIGSFRLAVESDGASPLAGDGEDYGEAVDPLWNAAFPIDGSRVAALLPEGVVIGPDEETASVAEVDGKIAWVVARKWAWPWRWGDAVVWADPAAACADKAAPQAFKRKYGKKTKASTKAKAEPVKAKAKSKIWPPVGGSLDEIAGLLERGVRPIGDSYHGHDYRRKYAVRTMALGMFERAAAALDGADGWSAWDPWFSAYARGEVVMTAMAGRVDEAPALTAEQSQTLTRWLTEAEALLKKKEARGRSACQPLAVIGAGWVLLGEAARGEKLLAGAVAVIEPETNQTEHRAVVAEAFAALGRRREAGEHLTSGGKPSWAHSGPAIAAICRRASVAELKQFHAAMKAKAGHNEFVVVRRGLDRLLALKAWDAASAWLKAFEGLSTSTSEAELARAMAAAGEPEAKLEQVLTYLKPDDPRTGEALAVLAEVAPRRAGEILAAMLPMAEKLGGDEASECMPALAGAAARLGRVELAERAEKAVRGAGDKQVVRFAVLHSLDPRHAAWGAWFERARASSSGDDRATELAVAAARGGHADAAALLDEAIEAQRAGDYPDIKLERLSGRMADIGDLGAAHRVYMAISKGKRSHRNQPLLDACVKARQWAGVLDLLATMPMDLNGSPQRASQVLLKVAGGEGF